VREVSEERRDADAVAGELSEECEAIEAGEWEADAGEVPAREALCGASASPKPFLVPEYPSCSKLVGFVDELATDDRMDVGGVSDALEKRCAACG
jgi:hypothetical protein